jgi:hypothetical protein
MTDALHIQEPDDLAARLRGRARWLVTELAESELLDEAAARIEATQVAGTAAVEALGATLQTILDHLNDFATETGWVSDEVAEIFVAARAAHKQASEVFRD